MVCPIAVVSWTAEGVLDVEEDCLPRFEDAVTLTAKTEALEANVEQLAQRVATLEGDVHDLDDRQRRRWA